MPQGEGHCDRARNAERTMILISRWQSGGNSHFVAKGQGSKYLIRLDGDVAERLKAAVC